MGEKKQSQADMIILLVEDQETTLFVDQYDKPYIRFSNHGVMKTYPLSSQIVKHWMSKLLWDDIQKAPGGEAINSALNVLKAEAIRIESARSKTRQIRIYRSGMAPQSSVYSVEASRGEAVVDATDVTDADLRSYSKEDPQ